jgi:short-subunit dehydrogenase
MALPPRAAKHVVITGASSGLGAALARAYARPGIALTLFARDELRLASVAASCKARGADVATIACDVTDTPVMTNHLISVDQIRPIDIVIANAGIGGKMAIAPSEGESTSIAHAMFATNTIGVINTATAIIPRFVSRKAGHLVVVSSLAGLIGLPQSPAYCGSKAAVRIYAEGLRRLVRPSGVRVTIVLAGFIDTPMSRSLPQMGPQVWSSDRAAEAIKSAVAKGKREMSFPWSLRFAVALSRLLPRRLVDAVLARAYRPPTFL